MSLGAIATKVFGGMIKEYNSNQLAEADEINRKLKKRIDVLEQRLGRRDNSITRAKLVIEENALAFDELEKRLETAQTNGEYLEDELAKARGEIARYKARGIGSALAEEPEANPYLEDKIVKNSIESARERWNCDICGDEFALEESESGVLCPDCEAPG